MIRIPAALREAAEAQIEACLKMARESGATEEQEHAEENTKARIYWHYGRGIGMRDLLRALDKADDG